MCAEFLIINQLSQLQVSRVEAEDPRLIRAARLPYPAAHLQYFPLGCVGFASA